MDKSAAGTPSAVRDGDCSGTRDVILGETVRKEGAGPAFWGPGGRMLQAIHIFAGNWTRFWTASWMPHSTSAEELRGEGLVPERRVGRLQSEEPGQAGV